MHRDHKLGLALGVLLVGFAAALCCPREQPVGLDGLSLKQTEQIDERIEQLPIRAYTSADRQLSSADHSDPSAPPPVADANRAFALPPPDPIPDGDDRSAPGSHFPQDTAESPPSATPPRFQRYVVRPGDTLSTIAARFLGSSQRYAVLFEANRDVLANPNDLRAGMELRIPAAPSATRHPQPPPAAPRAPVIDAEPRTSDGSRTAGRFQPARRAPFIQHGTDARRK